jgi:ABC-2 type transport system permease protein
MINFTAIYVLWLRDMKWLVRMKARLVITLTMPIFLLIFLGSGFKQIFLPGANNEIAYQQFLVPGLICMNIIFSSTNAGMSVLWDKTFGFLKEIMVAPVSRLSIVIGKIAGATTSALIQAGLILIISMFLGFKIKGDIWSILIALVFMILISTIFIGIGLILASVMKDMHSFGFILNFLIFPLFFLSGALYPIENLPPLLKWLSYLDPLTYGVDGLRGVLIGVSSFSLILDFILLLIFSSLMLFFGAFFFERTDAL